MSQKLTNSGGGKKEIIETYWNVNELLEGMSAEGIEGK